MDIACAFKQMEVEEKSQQIMKIKFQFQRLPFGVAIYHTFSCYTLYVVTEGVEMDVVSV